MTKKTISILSLLVYFLFLPELNYAFNPRLAYEYAPPRAAGFAVQENGKIIMAGVFQHVNDAPRNFIARLNRDGSLDPSFHSDPGPNGLISNILILDDGKILVSGFFSTFNNMDCNSIARLHADGSLDTSFNCSQGPDGFIHDMTLQDDGKIIIGGYFSTIQEMTRNNIARLHSDGTIDSTFSTGTGTNDRVRSVALQPDGKILIGGDFTIVRGNSRNRIARLNSDSSVDQSFSTGAGANNTVTKVILQPDNKILIGGYFEQVRGNIIRFIARLNPDSSVDHSFSPVIQSQRAVLNMALQPDGKIILGQFILLYNGEKYENIYRLNPDGSIDTGFNVKSKVREGVGDPVIVTALKIQPGGKILLGGTFNEINGISRTGVARLNYDGRLDQINKICFPIKASDGNLAIICL